MVNHYLSRRKSLILQKILDSTRSIQCCQYHSHGLNSSKKAFFYTLPNTPSKADKKRKAMSPVGSLTSFIDKHSRWASTIISSSSSSFCHPSMDISRRNINPRKKPLLRMLNTYCSKVEDQLFYNDLTQKNNSKYIISNSQGPLLYKQTSHKRFESPKLTSRSSLRRLNTLFTLASIPGIYQSSVSGSPFFYHTCLKNLSMNPSSDVSLDSPSPTDKQKLQTKKNASNDKRKTKEQHSESFSSTNDTNTKFRPTTGFNLSSGTTSLPDSTSSMLEPDLWDALESGQLGKLLPRRQIPKDVLTIETVAYWNTTSQVPIFGNVFGKNRPGQNNNVQVSPEQYKITLRVNISDLQLDSKSEARLRCLVGPRFNHKTNEIVLKSQRFLNRIHNMQYLVYLLENLVTEAKGENEGQVSVDEDMKEYNLHTGEKNKKDE